MSRRAAAAAALAVLIAAPLALAAGCTSAASTCKECQDIVTGVPWTAPESYSYQLKQDGKPQGTTTLSITQSGADVVLTQKSVGDNGTSDISAVTANATTLKPVSATRTLTGLRTRKVLDTTYEPIDTVKCSSGIVARIQQRVYQPPESTKPTSDRTVPKCVPLHTYDIDESLFVWRTIRFQKGSSVTFNNLATNNAGNHLVTLIVRDQEKVTVPAGTFDAWFVDIASERSRQKAWFATTPDHRLLQYVNNQGQSFQLEPGGG